MTHDRLLLAFLALVAMAATPVAAQTPPPRIGWLVVPFELSAPSARTYWLGEGVAVLLGDELERLGVRVVPRETRVGALDELRLPTASALSRATSIRVGELLGAPVAVFGEVATDESSLTITARRLQLDSGQLGQEIVEQGTLVDLFALCRSLAQRLADRDARPVAGTPRAVAPPLDAFEAYVKALLADRPEARVRLLDVALARAPAYDRIRLALWDAYSDLGEHPRALAALEGITDTSPVHRVARFEAALSLLELKRHDEAFEVLRALADARPEAAVLNNLGIVQLRRGATPQTGRPVYYFTKATELEPDDPDLFFNLGYAYWFDRDPQACIYWLRDALRRNPADADAHLVIAAALDAAGAGIEAGRERALAHHLSSRYADAARRGGAELVPRGLERLKDSLTRVQPMRFDKALSAATQRNQQELIAFHLGRARRLFEAKRDGDAEPELRRVLFLSPYHAEAHLLLGQVYRRSGRLRDAMAAFRISIWSEETAAAQVSLGEALLEARDRTGARAAVQRALELEPDSPDARALLAHLDATRVR